MARHYIHMSLVATLLAGCATTPVPDRPQPTIGVVCQTLDGARVMVDVVATSLNQSGNVALVRAIRQAVCAGLGYTVPLAPEVAPISVPRSRP